MKKRSVFFRWKLELLIYIASRLKIIIGLPFKIIKLFWIISNLHVLRKNRDRYIKKKKKKKRQNSISKKLFFARNEHRKIQLFVFHCFETKVSPNVFNKRSLAECRYLGPRLWPAHYAGHLHSHDFEQVLTTIGKLGGRGPSCVHGRRAKVCEKVNRTRRFSTAPRYNGSIVRVSSSWQGVFYCGGLETVVGVAWPLEMENGQGIFMGQGMKSGGVLRIIHLVVGRAS